MSTGSLEFTPGYTLASTDRSSDILAYAAGVRALHHQGTKRLLTDSAESSQAVNENHIMTGGVDSRQVASTIQ